MSRNRASGVLLHPTSLDTHFGVGDFGPSARTFIDFLVETGQTYWQILPLNPTQPVHGNSPYHSVSAFALNPLLISPQELVAAGLLKESELVSPPTGQPDRVDFLAAHLAKAAMLKVAARRFTAPDGPWQEALTGFEDSNGPWLEDYALFEGLKGELRGLPWTDWPAELRDRSPQALALARQDLADRLAEIKFQQFIAWQQWFSLKEYANSRGVSIIGDLPIYVVHDSVDVWANRRLFKLDEEGLPEKVSGVPPDYFSETGQLWGNPVYDWPVHAEQGFGWWLARFEHGLRQADFLRLDHFRGFESYWEIPAGQKTAVHGTWQPGPGAELFKAVRDSLGLERLIAEDLGLITDQVRSLVTDLGLPGMKLLMFAFGRDMPANPYAPHNHIRNCLIYPGTHDNNSARGWWEKEATEEEKANLESYLGRRVSPSSVAGELARLTWASVADTAIASMQDLLGLGATARMNLPGTKAGNWQWRLEPGWRTKELEGYLTDITRLYGRTRTQDNA